MYFFLGSFILIMSISESFQDCFCCLVLKRLQMKTNLGKGWLKGFTDQPSHNQAKPSEAIYRGKVGMIDTFGAIPYQHLGFSSFAFLDPRES